MNIRSLFHVNLNCRSLDVSLPFYLALGFQVEIDFPEGGDPDVGRMLGVGEHRVKGALLRLGDGPDAARLDLLEWIRPKREPQPARLSLTDPGVPRFALMSDDFEADVAKLREMGVEFVAEPLYRQTKAGRLPTIVCFRDPDGNVLELIARRSPRAPGIALARPVSREAAGPPKRAG